MSVFLDVPGSIDKCLVVYRTINLFFPVMNFLKRIYHVLPFLSVRPQTSNWPITVHPYCKWCFLNMRIMVMMVHLIIDFFVKIRVVISPYENRFYAHQERFGNHIHVLNFTSDMSTRMHFLCILVCLFAI